MRRVYVSALAVAAVTLLPAVSHAQEDANRKIAGGGITAQGWMGKADGTASVADSKLSKEGDALHVVTGPAVTYWNPANKASGDYTVKATFTEPKFMSLNDHAHPYGIVIAGNDLGTDQQSLLYCEAYGDGRFIVRGFGPASFKPNGRGESNEAIHKAAGKDQPVTQEIAMSVKGDKITCAVNGTVVGTYDKASLVGPGKLKSTDGVYGIRFAHNTEGTVTGLAVTKP
jgi:hypothetical protein